MFLTSKEKLREKIVHILVEQPGLGSGDLLAALLTQNNSLSEQALFKELRILIAEAVLIKVERRYFLSVDWSAKLVEFLGRYEQSALQFSTIEQLLPEGRRQRTFRFSQLRTLKQFWSKLVGQLIAGTQSQHLLSWNPSPWFYYTQPDHQAALMMHLRKRGVHMYKILGQIGFAHKRIQSTYWPKDLVSWSSNLSRYHGRLDYYFSVIDNYLLELHMPKKLGEAISKECSQGGGNELSKFANLHSLESQKARLTLTLSQSTRKASYHRRYFDQYFI